MRKQMQDLQATLVVLQHLTSIDKAAIERRLAADAPPPHQPPPSPPPGAPRGDCVQGETEVSQLEIEEAKRRCTPLSLSLSPFTLRHQGQQFEALWFRGALIIIAITIAITIVITIAKPSDPNPKP
jgi:hypothetical protein